MSAPRISIKLIARQATKLLGRQASRSKKWMDGSAVQAVKTACLQAEVPEVWHWAYPGHSVRQLVWDYISRSVQAYGPIDLSDDTGLIDAGAHIGSKKPIIVKLAARRAQEAQPG